MASEDAYTGGCACQAIRDRITGAPAFVFMCHCRDCQRATGSTYAPNAWFPYAQVQYVKGEPGFHVVTGESGKPVYHEFCAKCGSSVGMRSDGYSGYRAVRIASLDDPDLLESVADVWTGSRIRWDPLHPTLPKYESVVPEQEFMAILEGR
jgi:hypothetical protein